MVAKIALEEHFLSPEMIPYWEPSVSGMPKPVFDAIRARLIDFDELRLEAMDKAGVTLCVLGLSGPGMQVEPDAALATRLARQSNDFLAERVARNPQRLAGFAHLAMQEPAQAAEELQRCVRDLGFKGAMINGHTFGHYLDEDIYAPFWERAEALDVPIYLHPADPQETYAAMRGQKRLRRPTWEWTVETATHALRLVFNGTFEKYPKARLILGHMGETLPYLLWRFDSRAIFQGFDPDKGLMPSQIIKRNIAVTISGMFSDEPLT